MKKAIFVLLAAIFSLTLSAPASAFTIHERYVHTDAGGKVTVFYTAEIAISGLETSEFDKEMEKLVKKIIFEVYPAEPKEIKNNLASYTLQIVVKISGQTVAYIEFSISKDFIEQIIAK